jgi:hypothetical protein
MSEQKLVEIAETEVVKQQISAFSFINKLEVIIVKSKEETSNGRRDMGYRSTVHGATSASNNSKKVVRLTKTIEEIDNSSPMMSDKEHHVLSSIYRATCISGAVYEMYKKASGMDSLLKKNVAGQLDAKEREKLKSLLRTCAVINVSVISNFLQREFSESSHNSGIKVGELGALDFDNPSNSLGTFFYELESNIKEFSLHSENIASVVYEVANKALNKIDMMVEGLEYTNYFTSFTYQVEKDEFEISGFDRASMAKSTELIMEFKKPEEVIGNAIAKYNAEKIAKMMMCYDFERKLNPFADLGGFIFTFFGDGFPGTGKTTLIQMMTGLLHDYCQNANYPFHYENFTVDNIDSFQGKSAQHTKQFIKNVTNPNVIGFGTIDDIDQIAGKRGDAKASEGQLGVTATLMESFAGANTKILGNASFGMFTNHADHVDPALRQRAGARFLIDGPQSYEDFVDISALFAGSNHNIPTGDIELGVSQKIKKALSESYEKHNSPETEELQAILENTLREVGEITTMADIGRYLHNISQVDDRFTGRAVANIFNSATSRTMDFDMPNDWFEDPETFLFLPYQTKKDMISELKGTLDTKTIIQEINRYADSEFRYTNSADDIEIDKMVKNIELQQKVTKRLGNQG